MAEFRSGVENVQNDPGTSVTIDNKEAIKDHWGHNNGALKLH